MSQTKLSALDWKIGLPLLRVQFWNRLLLNKKDLPKLGLILVAVLCLEAVFVTPYMVAASVGYFLLLTGLLMRKEPKLHATLMSVGMLMDLTIVLFLEFNRDAIQTAMELKLSAMQQMHIYSSTVAVLLYFPVFALGLTRIRGKGGKGTKVRHIKAGLIAFFFRTLGFLLMFSLLFKE